MKNSIQENCFMQKSSSENLQRTFSWTFTINLTLINSLKISKTKPYQWFGSCRNLFILNSYFLKGLVNKSLLFQNLKMCLVENTFLHNHIHCWKAQLRNAKDSFIGTLCQNHLHMDLYSLNFFADLRFPGIFGVLRWFKFYPKLSICFFFSSYLIWLGLLPGPSSLLLVFHWRVLRVLFHGPLNISFCALNLNDLWTRVTEFSVSVKSQLQKYWSPYKLHTTYSTICTVNWLNFTSCKTFNGAHYWTCTSRYRNSRKWCFCCYC